MPRRAIPFVPDMYDPTPGTIRMSELNRRRADDQAALRLREGDISATMAQQLAGIGAGVAQSIGQYHADAPKRAAAKTEGAKQDALRRSVDPATGKMNYGQAAREVAQIDPLAAQALWDKASEEEKLQLLTQKQKVDEIARVAGALAVTVAKLPPPQRQDAYAEARADVIARGLVPEDALDPIYKPNVLKALVSQAMEAKDLFTQIESAIAPPKTREIKTRNADGTESIQIVEDTPGQSFMSTPEPKPTMEQEAARAGAITTAQERARLPFREPRESKAPTYQRIETVDAAGNPVVKFMTAEEVRAMGGVPTSPKTTAKASGPATVDAILGEIEGLSQQINTSGGGPMSNVTGAVRRGLAASNLDNTVSEYSALVNGFIPMVARAVGHTGVLTQQDVDSVRALFPQTGDNAELAAAKLARVRRIMAAMQPSEPGSRPVSPATPPAAPAAPVAPRTNPFRRK